MKTYIMLLTLIISNIAFAGGSVGTMRTAQEQLQKGIIKTDKSELIFNMGTKDGLQKFAQARIVKGQWEVAEYVAPLEAVEADFDFSQVLLESKTVQNWAELQK